jgi:outer membrane receptor protein involved in Fe transport
MNGWVDAPNRDDVNDNRTANYRLKIRARPVDNLEVGLSVWRSENDLDTPNMGGTEGRVTGFVDQPNPTEFTAYGLKVAYDFPGFSLSSTTSHFDYSMESILDLNLLAVGFDPIANPNPQPFGITTNNANRMLAEELLLTSTDGGLWDWTLGAFYRDRDEQIVQDFGPNLATALTRTKDNSKSYAIFGELRRWLIPDELQFTAGLRYFREDQTTVEPHFVRTTKPEATTPRLVLTWFPSEALTFYGSYSEGFRSGVAQQEVILNVVPGFDALKPDLLRNYELGAKGDLAGGLLSFDAAAYYIDWRDVQQFASVTVTVGSQSVGGPAMFNAGSASGLGFDLALAARPVDGLELGVTYSWNDLTFDEDIDFGATHLFDKGDRLSASPETTASIYADYRFPFGGSGFRGVLSGSLNYVSPQNSVSLARGRAESDESRISQASFALEAPEHWTARLFVDNLTNEQVNASPFNFLPEWEPQIRPRTVGLQFEYKY